MTEYSALEQKGKDNLRKPFRAILDYGVRRITTGNRIFGAMKGAVDSGLNVPHSVKRFPGFKKVKGNKSGEYEAEVHASRILGRHVDDYWGELEENNNDKAKAHFNQWQKCLDKNKVESIPDLYAKVLTAIRSKPERKANTKAKHKHERKGDKIVCGNKTWLQLKKLSKAAKRELAKERIQNAMTKMQEE